MESEGLTSHFIPDYWTWNTELLSNKVKLVDPCKQIVCFHPHYSRGTAGIRGNKVLNKGQPAIYYWEVKLVNRVFGTSMMFGVGTKKCRLYSDSFINMVGENDQGWALSHKGLLWHNGKWKPFTSPFRENESTIIGILFDSYKGNLIYFKDGINLGVAFTGLDKITSDLYPIVSSSAAKTEMMLCRMYKSYHILNLQERCRDVITKKLTTVEQLNKLYLPPNLRNFIKQNLVNDKSKPIKMNYPDLNINVTFENDHSSIKSNYQPLSQHNSIELKRLPTYLLL